VRTAPWHRTASRGTGSPPRAGSRSFAAAPPPRCGGRDLEAQVEFDRTRLRADHHALASRAETNRGQTQVQPVVSLWSTWFGPGVKPGSSWGQAGVKLGTPWGQTWVNLHRPTILDRLDLALQRHDLVLLLRRPRHVGGLARAHRRLVVAPPLQIESKT